MTLLKKNKKPLISCLCLTNNRPSFLKRSIEYFQAQTYSNKEMIIVYKSNDSATIDLLSEIKDDRIKSFETSSDIDQTTGDLRNFSIKCSTGDFFCQWDDDDWCHSRRLELQLQAIIASQKKACVLAYWLFHDLTSKQSYFSFPEMWAGSIMCSKDLITSSICYPSLNQHEDFNFLQKLFKINCVVPFVKPQLYVYLYHCSNTMSKAHFELLFSKSQPLSSNTSKLINDIVTGIYTCEQGSSLIDNASIINEFDYFYTNAQKPSSS